jgi:hypothetical protein
MCKSLGWIPRTEKKEEIKCTNIQCVDMNKKKNDAFADRRDLKMF